MVEVKAHTVAEIRRSGDSLPVEDMVLLIERNHPHDQPGISRETIARYAEALATDPDEGRQDELNS